MVHLYTVVRQDLVTDLYRSRQSARTEGVIFALFLKIYYLWISPLGASVDTVVHVNAAKPCLFVNVGILEIERAQFILKLILKLSEFLGSQRAQFYLLRCSAVAGIGE
jgi:hypothetical protein